MTEQKFVDHYEILQLSPNATGETVERVFRFLAKRYHPDNQDTGDAVQFAAIHTAYELLTNPVSRASYDAKYEHNRAVTWKISSRKGPTTAAPTISACFAASSRSCISPAVAIRKTAASVR